MRLESQLRWDGYGDGDKTQPKLLTSWNVDIWICGYHFGKTFLTCQESQPMVWNLNLGLDKTKRESRQRQDWDKTKTRLRQD